MSEPTELQADPDAAEEFAEEVGVDPTQEEIDHYRQLEGEPPAAEPITPDAELPDPSDAPMVRQGLLASSWR